MIWGLNPVFLLTYVRVSSGTDVQGNKGIIALVNGDGINAEGASASCCGCISQGGQGGASSHIISTSYSNREAISSGCIVVCNSNDVASPIANFIFLNIV